MTLSNCWRRLIEMNGWRHARIDSDFDKRNRLFLRNCKEGVSIRILSSDKVILPNWIFVETQKAYEIGACEVSVLLVPMESVEDIYTKNIRSKLSFEDVEFQLNELSPIRTKHPDIHAKVKIEQDGNIVRLHIETEEGTKEIIERTLEDYTRVVANQEPVETLFDNKIHIIALQNRLEMANMEVRQTREILELTKEASNMRFLSLEEEVQYLRSHIGSQMSLANESNKIIQTQATASSKVALEFINSSNLLIKDLLADKLTDLKVLEALELIDKRLEVGVSQDDEVVVKNALHVIAQKSPDIVDELSVALKNTAYGVSGNIVYQWLVSILNMLC